MTDAERSSKQGKESVGVKRQYCGQLGKRANCQAGVFVGYASRQGYTLLDRRLYLPAEWLTDAAFAERRLACGIPAETTFRTKQALALEMIQAVVRDGQLRCRWVTADEAFGRDTVFLDGVTACGLWYFSKFRTPRECGWSVRGDGRAGVDLARPERTCTMRQAGAGSTAEQRAPPASHLPPRERHLIKKGSQGPLLLDFAVCGWLPCVTACQVQTSGLSAETS